MIRLQTTCKEQPEPKDLLHHIGNSRTDATASVWREVTFCQSDHDPRCEWGVNGAFTLAPVSDAIIIVGVMSFSTAVVGGHRDDSWRQRVSIQVEGRFKYRIRRLEGRRIGRLGPLRGFGPSPRLCADKTRV